MGSIILKEIGGLSEHPNTKKEYDNEISHDELVERIFDISQMPLLSDSKVCYIFGMGSHPKSTYKLLEDEKGIEVIWYGSILPKFARLLRFIVASYAGLVKVKLPDRINDVFLKLADCSMVGLYCFDASLESAFVEKIIDNPLPEYYDFGIKNDRGYFFYIVDADNTESGTGIYEIVSYGIDASCDFRPK